MTGEHEPTAVRLPGRSIRTRLTIASAIAVALAVALASVAVFVVVRRELVQQVDQSLREQAAKEGCLVVSRFPLVQYVCAPALGGWAAYVQVVDTGGEVARPAGEPIKLPVHPATLAVAAGRAGAFFSDETVAGVHVRVYTVPGQGALAVQIARPLTEVDSALARLKLILLFVMIAGTALAAFIGRLVARAGLAPITRLTETTERITETGDLSQRIQETGTDEVGRLASRFNAMLDALQASERAQRRLVADASHELRTPLTSLRTNIEVLARAPDLAPQEKERLLADLVAELESFSMLVGDLLELAREGDHVQEFEDVRLDRIVEAAAERARRRSPRLTFLTDTSPTIVKGVPSQLDRAVTNLLENAAKWSPDASDIEVSVHDGVVTVRDQGPGIDEKDLPFVFDRFYRAESGRSMPGSGLGLAIVRQVAETHGGSVRAENADGGGARLVLELSPIS